MTEREYITATNLARLRLITEALHQMIATKDLPAESIDSFQKWAFRMVDRHHGLLETKP